MAHKRFPFPEGTRRLSRLVRQRRRGKLIDRVLKLIVVPSSPPDAWLEWIEDEKRQAEDRDEKEEIIDLYKLAVQDYRCASFGLCCNACQRCVCVWMFRCMYVCVLVKVAAPI